MNILNKANRYLAPPVSWCEMLNHASSTMGGRRARRACFSRKNHTLSEPAHCPCRCVTSIE